MTKAVEERTSTEMVEVLKGGSFYINTSHSSPTFALGAGMQKMDFTNFAETKAEKGKIVTNVKAGSYPESEKLSQITETYFRLRQIITFRYLIMP